MKLLVLLACLFASAVADSVIIGLEPLNATDLNAACVQEHGAFYKFVSSDSGVLLVQGLGNDVPGVEVARNIIGKCLNRSTESELRSHATIGGGCKARVYQSCNTSDDGCFAAVSCTDPDGQQRCVDCQPAKFQKIVAGKVQQPSTKHCHIFNLTPC
jgi:hypothetical protein